MSKEFIKGNTYVFTKKKFLKTEGRKTYKISKDWVDGCNGSEVVVLNESNSITRGYFISPEWCKCIKVN
ncbi:hypothetical protein [Clostridium sp.]|uniref:hypothetical protein n=1 Tax=Clostridium sp. TaxID=1506 RepID=UPI00321799FF